jgi:hypothetical protein
VKFSLRLLLGLLTLVAMASQLVSHVRMGANVVNFFSWRESVGCASPHRVRLGWVRNAMK